MFILLLAAPCFATDWAAAMATGDCPGVVAALPEPSRDLERLALARCLDRLGEDGRAAELAAGIADASLLPFARLVRARALLDRDNAAGAVEASDGLTLPGHEDELLRGRALVLSHRSVEARDGLRSLTEVPAAAAEARYWLAFGAEDRGDRDAAVAAYRAAWVKDPGSPWAERAAKRLHGLSAPVPDAATPAGQALMLDRARALLKDMQAPDAIPLLDAIASAQASDPAWPAFFADALFEAQDYGRARDAYAAAPGTLDDPAATFQYALATARAGDYAAAEVLYNELVSKFPRSPQADEAAWKPAYMKHDEGNLAGAVEALEGYLSRHPSGKFAADAKWFKAWDLHRLGRDVEAATEMQGLLTGWPNVELAAAARYWRARIQDDKQGYATVMSVYPDSGYAWFAAWRLGKTFPKLDDPVRPELPAAFVAAHPGVATARLLIEGGMPDWARPLLAGYAGDAAKDKSTAIAYAWLLADAEDYHGAKKLACPYKSERAALGACLLRPHRGTVAGVASEFGLDPLLPYAIMNAESALDPSVTSPAGAMGLMQLMPKLAADLAKDRIPGFHPTELYRAGVNARLGSTELGLLSRRWERGGVQPRLPLVIAAYNGGAAAVDRWLSGYTTPPPIDEFAENISFTETRRYVRRVLGFLQSYRRAYGDG